MSTRNPAAVLDDQSTVALTVVLVVLVDVHCGCLRGGACDTATWSHQTGRGTAISMASPGFSARTMPIAAVEAAEWQRSDRRPSPVNGARASKTPLRRGRHRGLLGPASRLEA